jgi:hypothetical protein
MEDLVECRSESSYPDKPVALTWEGLRHPVDSVLGQWRSPQGIHFRVRTTDNLVFELNYIIAADGWHITPIQED